jgi:hypothetical protein
MVMELLIILIGFEEICVTNGGQKVSSLTFSLEGLKTKI